MGVVIRVLAAMGLAITIGCANPARFDALKPETAVAQVRGDSSVSGYGFFVAPDGVMVTSRHVVADAKTILVTLADGRQLPATLINEDKESDVALLKVAAQEKGKEFRILHLNDEDAEPGMHVRAVMGAKTLQGRFDHWEELGRVIDFTAVVGKGDAGAPLLADDGRVIGVVLGPFEMHSMAAPAWQALRLMPELAGPAKFGH